MLAVFAGVHGRHAPACPYPVLKFPTLLSRITQNHVLNGLLFFRTSAAARATPRFLRETAMLPPLAYGVCVETLVEMATHAHPGKLLVHIADEEGDPYAVALAGRLKAWVAGRDSDFVVLNAEGYQGYIPLDEMVWTVAHSPPPSRDGEGNIYSSNTRADDSGFMPVHSSKARKRRAAVHQSMGRGFIPPEDAEGSDKLSLSFTIYSPSTLASHLEIPVSLLPLLGALVGNDYTGSSDDSSPPPTTAAELRGGRRANLQRLFFERQLTLGQRIDRVAKTLNEILAAAFGQGTAPPKKRTKKQIGSVMDLIDAAVTALLLRPLDAFATGEKEAIVERVVEATLRYAIPRPEGDELLEGSVGLQKGHGVLKWASDVCPLHTSEACPLFASLSRLVPPRLADSSEGETRAMETPHEDIRALYITAYRRGYLNPHILDAVQTGTTWPSLFLEDPDKECVKISVGRSIREWTYAILDASVGLSSPSEPETLEGQDEPDEDEDALVDVVEEDRLGDTDPLARLKGALKELDESEVGDESTYQESAPSTLSTSTDAFSSRPKVVTEYVRRGTRLAGEEVKVPPLSQLLARVSLEGPVHAQASLPLPPPLWPEDRRRKLLISAAESNYPAVDALPDDHLLAVLALRFVVRRMHLRALDNPRVKERQLERWTQAEARAFLMCIFSREREMQEEDITGDLEESKTIDVPVVERHVQLVAQLFAALEAIEQLSHVLLLAPRIANPARLFSGRRLHALLNGLGPSAESLDEELWRACWEGLEDAYASKPQKKSKKEKKKLGESAIPAKDKAKGPGNIGGMFGLLADAEA
ncbi:hypothetical protein BD414DRAFT_498891 [Trametes punicea]|nr:hypothetical protein BD414DRAFT_498891 [Trametes punicea]